MRRTHFYLSILYTSKPDMLIRFIDRDDQYKKKFREWYNQGRMPQKHARKRGAAASSKSRELILNPEKMGLTHAMSATIAEESQHSFEISKL
jgi:hypothetical protein